MYLISNQETAKEMWECLSEQYEKTDTIHAIALFHQLTTFHIDSTNLSITTTKTKKHPYVITATNLATGRKTVEPSKETCLIIKIPK